MIKVCYENYESFKALFIYDEKRTHWMGSSWNDKDFI